MNYLEAFASAERFIEGQKAKDISHLNIIRNKIISNPNISTLFGAIKDIISNNDCEQVIFLNPLEYLFSEDFPSAEHFGIYKDRYTSLHLLGTMPDGCHLNLNCGRPGIVIVGKDWLREVKFSDYSLPNLFDDELALSSFIIELEKIIPNYKCIALAAYRDSDYGITTRDLELLTTSEQKRFNCLVEDYLFNYGIVDIDLNFRNEKIESCEAFYDWGLLWREGTIGVVSRKTYSIIGNESLGERKRTYSYPSFLRNKRSLVGMQLKLTIEPLPEEKAPLKWF